MREIRKKVVLFGNVGVGKSSITRRFVKNEFSETYMSSIGLSIEKKIIERGDLKVILMIWDLAGEIFEGNQFDSYVKGAHGIVGIFDTSRIYTYDLLTNCLKSKSECPRIIVGNKIDLISQEEIDALKKMNVDHFTSAKTGTGLDEAFNGLVDKMISTEVYV